MSHWTKLDHVAFILILFCLIFAFLLHILDLSKTAINCLIIIGMVLWIIAFIYDLTEKKDVMVK